jgi:hypothetical protein
MKAGVHFAGIVSMGSDSLNRNTKSYRETEFHLMAMQERSDSCFLKLRCSSVLQFRFASSLGSSYSYSALAVLVLVLEDTAASTSTISLSTSTRRARTSQLQNSSPSANTSEWMIPRPAFEAASDLERGVTHIGGSFREFVVNGVVVVPCVS